MGITLSPDGRYLAVTNDGHGVQSVMLVDTKTEKVIQTIKYPAPQALFVGIQFSPDGNRLYASAGKNDKIRVYDFKNGKLSETDPIQLGSSTTYFPAGLDITPDGSRLLVANNIDNSVRSCVD